MGLVGFYSIRSALLGLVVFKKYVYWWFTNKDKFYPEFERGFKDKIDEFFVLIIKTFFILNELFSI